MLHSVVSLDYERPPTLAAREFADAIIQRQIVGHKCPQCARIYTPPRGYCPICVIPTGKEHLVDISDHGTLVTYTALNPDALHQQGGEATLRASVRLDGTKITQQGDALNVTQDQIHVGMKMRAVWLELSKEDAAEAAGWGWGVPGIAGWEPTGEPDASPEEIQALLEEGGD
jgi:uncharacterized OB-fold protein